MPPKTAVSILKRPKTELEKLLDPEDDSGLRAAVANKRSRSQRLLSHQSIYKDQHSHTETVLSVYNNKSLLTGPLYRQHQEQSRFLDYSTGFFCLARSRVETEGETRYRENKYGPSVLEGPGPRLVHHTCLIPLFPFLNIVKKGDKLAKEVEEEADNIIKEGVIGESGEIPLLFYEFYPSGPRGKKHFTEYVVQVSTYAYSQRVKGFVNPPPPGYSDLRVDVRAKSSLNAERGADRSSLQSGGTRFANNGFIVEYDHFLSLLRSNNFKEMLAKGKDLVTQYFSSNDDLDPKAFLMTPRPRPNASLRKTVDEIAPKKPWKITTLTTMPSQSRSSVQAREEEEVEMEEERDGRTGNEEDEEEVEEVREEDQDVFGGDVEDDDEFFREAANMNETVTMPTVRAVGTRGKKSGMRTPRK